MPKRKFSQKVTSAKRTKFVDLTDTKRNGPNKPSELPKHNKPNGSIPSIHMPQLVSIIEPTKRTYQEVMKDLRSLRIELDDIATFDEDTNKWTPHGELDDDDQKEFHELCEQYERIDKEYDNLLDLVKHNFMKWVECTEEEYKKLHNTSSYYYYISNEDNEIMQRGCWQFTTQHVQHKYEQHFDQRLVEYFYYGRPIYQHPDFEEDTDADIAIDNGTYNIITADKFFKQNMHVLENGTSDDIQRVIELFNDSMLNQDYNDYNVSGIDCIAAFQQLLPHKPILECMEEIYAHKCTLAWLIKKHHFK